MLLKVSRLELLDGAHRQSRKCIMRSEIDIM